MSNVKYNDAYEKRLAQTIKLLGRDQEETKIDEDTGETVVVKIVYRGKPITREMAQDLEYRAIVAEGRTLYQAQQYRRAIDAFSQAMDIQKEDQSILIDRANSYIKVGQPEDALKDVDAFLSKNPNDPRAILTKAEAYFSMGEFEFALVFFQRGINIRKDMSGFKDGIIKCKSAILDAINGKNLFQANPNFAVSRPRKSLIDMPKEKTATQQVDEAKLQETAALLPEKVEPLQVPAEKAQYLGELQLDYDYLLELQEEVKVMMNEAQDDEQSKAEDEKISQLVADALIYLDQRGDFWYQQGGPEKSENTTAAEGQTSQSTSARSPIKSPNRTRSSGRTLSKARAQPKNGQRTAHYEMSKIQQYEAKYGSPDRKTRSPTKATGQQYESESNLQ